MASATLDILDRLTRGAGLPLFPTENRLSPRAQAAVGADISLRYPGSEGPGFFYGDPLDLQAIYDHCADLACEYFSAHRAVISFLSGLHTARSVLSAMATAGDAVMILDATCGGHYATEGICRRFGLEPHPIPFDRDECMIVTERLRDEVQRTDARLVYLDMSTAIRMPRLADVRAALPEHVRICLDASQLLALVPHARDRIGLETGITSISGSTHKSFPGPQKGLFVSNDADANVAMSSALGLCVSSAHANNVAALAITLAELIPLRERYAQAIVSNASAFGRALAARGFDVQGRAWDFSETHQVWVAPPAGVDPSDWGKRLVAAGIRSTVVCLPATGEPGSRFGVQELTRMGMDEATMDRIADLLARCLLDGHDPIGLRPAVDALVAEFPTVAFVAALEDQDGEA